MSLVVLGDGLLARSIRDVAPNAILLGHADFEITSLDSLVAALTPHKPDVIVNTVAYHRLRDCENDPMLARLINEDGARRVAQLAPTVYISTDYVFASKGPHDESLPGKRPPSVYGQTKLGGELATLEHGGIVVRVSGVYGHHASHKGPSFPDLVTTGFDPMKVPTDQRFAPTYAPDAAARIVMLASLLELGGEGAPQGIYHAANAGSASWFEFATQIAETTRHKRTITGFAAKDSLRPTNSVLRSTRLSLLPHWVDGLVRWASKRDAELARTHISPLRADRS